MIAQMVLGGRTLLRGLQLLSQPGIRQYVVIPLILNIALFGAGIWYIHGWLQKIFDWIDGFLPSWLHWLQWLLVPLLVIAVAITLFSLFSMLLNLVAAPFNSLLAEQVEYQQTGRFATGKPITMQSLLADTAPLLWGELNKILYALLWMIPFLLLFIIPVVNVVAPLFWILYSTWMLAIQYMDIPMNNHALNGRQVRQTLRQKRALSMGFGGMTLLLTSLPFVNFLAMPAAVAGATLLWLEQFAQEQPTPDTGEKPFARS
ncbi:MAG: sulfate transporter CysZ [Magnetococcus sp. XQGC-1]